MSRQRQPGGWGTLLSGDQIMGEIMDSSRCGELVGQLVDMRRVPATESDTRMRVVDGSLHRLTKTIYFDREAWDKLKPYEQDFLRCYAASSQSIKAVLVGKSAARVCGVWVIPRRNDAVTLADPKGQPTSRKGQWTGYEYRYMALHDYDIVRDGTLRFTNAVRTAIDVAREHGVDEGIVAIDSVLSGHDERTAQSIVDEFSRTIERMAGTRGIGNARKALARANRFSESPYESLLRLVFERWDVPFHQQVQIGPYRVDFLVGKNVVVEVDGEEKYEEDPVEAGRHQRTREDWLREQGYEVLRVYPGQIRRNELAVIQRLRASWDRAQQRLPVSEAAGLWNPSGPGRQVHLPDGFLS